MNEWRAASPEVQALIARLQPPAPLGLGLYFEAPVRSLLIVLASLLVGIVVHELGHALAGWAAGTAPRIITLGSGRVVWRFRRAGVWWVWRRHPFSGRVLSLPPWDGRRGPMAWLLAGGPLATVLLAAVLAFAAWQWPGTRREFQYALSVQLLLLASSLVPLPSAAGLSDGLQLLRLVREPPPDLRTIYAGRDGAGSGAASGGLVTRGPSPRDRVRQEVSFRLFCLAGLDEPWIVQSALDGVQGIIASRRLSRFELTVVLLDLLRLEASHRLDPAGEDCSRVWLRSFERLAGTERALVFRGMVLVKGGELDAARAALEAAYALPQDVLECAATAMLMAEALVGQGDEAGARHWLRVARDLPHDEESCRAMPAMEASVALARRRGQDGTQGSLVA